MTIESQAENQAYFEKINLQPIIEGEKTEQEKVELPQSVKANFEAFLPISHFRLLFIDRENFEPEFDEFLGRVFADEENAEAYLALPDMPGLENVGHADSIQKRARNIFLVQSLLEDKDDKERLDLGGKVHEESFGLPAYQQMVRQMLTFLADGRIAGEIGDKHIVDLSLSDTKRLVQKLFAASIEKGVLNDDTPTEPDPLVDIESFLELSDNQKSLIRMQSAINAPPVVQQSIDQWNSMLK